MMRYLDISFGFLWDLIRTNLLASMCCVEGGLQSRLQDPANARWVRGWMENGLAECLRSADAVCHVGSNLLMEEGWVVHSA